MSVLAHFHREAIEHLGRTRMRAELARAHLLYGEWLRRQCRPGNAWEELRTALGMLEAMGMEGLSERTRRELRTAGKRRARKRTVSMSLAELTVREAQVAKLAHEGLSFPGIGVRLYISARTAEYHLSKVFIKLNITSRVQLEGALTYRHGHSAVHS
jgi:DNA-binding CsgD family transcriptional regulator